MTVAMSGINCDKCFVYLDDLIVFGRNLDGYKVYLSCFILCKFFTDKVKERQLI